jgi:DnaJ-class molecular chaperone
MMKKTIHTHYDNLRIKRNASPGIIKAAYRALSAEYHPDKNPDRDTTRIMQMLNDAYAVLSDPAARERYDARIDAEEAAQTGDADAPPKSMPRPAPPNAHRQQHEQPGNEEKSDRQGKLRPTKGAYIFLAALFALLLVLVAVLVNL